jgi:hypothetical protein
MEFSDVRTEIEPPTLAISSMPFMLGNSSSPRLARSSCVRPGPRTTVLPLNASHCRRCSLPGPLQHGAHPWVRRGAPRYLQVGFRSYALAAEGDNCPCQERQHECQDQAFNQHPDDNAVSQLRVLRPSGTIIEQSCRHPADKRSRRR